MRCAEFARIGTVDNQCWPPGSEFVILLRVLIFTFYQIFKEISEKSSIFDNFHGLLRTGTVFDNMPYFLQCPGWILNYLASRIRFRNSGLRIRGS
jgi:hypothetical protein